MTPETERNRWTREYRKRTGNRATHKYEKTVKGFLMRKYRNMQSRVTGVQKLKAHLYRGKDLLSREEFYDWALNSEDFKRKDEEGLGTNWILFNHKKKMMIPLSSTAEVLEIMGASPTK